MRQFKELNACIAQLRALQARNDIGPEQKKNVDAAIDRLRRLRRRADAGKPEIYNCIREVADLLIKAFMK